MRNNMYLKRMEKWLKRSLKRKISINHGVLVAFLITGFLGFSEKASADESMEEFRKRIASDFAIANSTATNFGSGYFQSNKLSDQFNVIIGSQGDNMQLSFVNGRLNSTLGAANYIGFKRKDIIIDSEVSDDGLRMIHGPNFDPKGDDYYWFTKGDILQNVTFSAKFPAGKDYIEGIGKNGEVVRYNVGDKIDYIKLTEDRRLYLSGNLKDSLFNINSYFFKKGEIEKRYNDTMKAGEKVEGAVTAGYAAGIEGGANYAIALGAYSRVTEGSEGSIALGSYSIADGTKVKGYIDDKGNELKRLKNGKFYLAEHVKLGTDGKTLVLTDQNNPEVTPDKVTQLMGVFSIGGERTLLNADGSTPTIKVRRKLEGLAEGKNDDDAVTIGQIKFLINNGNKTVVYTDKDGKQVTKAKDGKYYLKESVDINGNIISSPEGNTPEEVKEIILSLVNPDGTTAPTPGANGTKVAKTLLRNVADGQEDTDAVNVGQLKKVSNNTIQLTGDKNSEGDAVKLNEELKFAFLGNEDITTEAKGKEVSFTLNKATKVTEGDNKVVTSDAVHTALNGYLKIDGSNIGSEDNKANFGKNVGLGEITGETTKLVQEKAVKKYVDTTVDGISKITGNGKDGKDGSDGMNGASVTGPSGKDGLNGKDLTEKTNALRNGEAGTVVYTDQEGNRLVKANDGKYYLASKVKKDGNTENGATPIETKDVRLALVNSEGETTKPTILGNVADGKVEKGSKDAVNGGQLAETNTKVNDLEETVTANSKFKFKTDKEKDSDPALEHNLTDVLNIKGDKNISVTSKDKDNIQIALKDDVSVKTIKAGETDETGNLTNGVTAGKEGLSYIAEDGTKIGISKDGIDAGGKKISHVADGEVSGNSQDAVNGKQLYETNQRIDEMEHNNKHIIEKINNNSRRIEKLDKKVNKGLANAAAMAGIEFMEVGLNQATIAASVGGYKGTQAVAVGVQGAPSENIRINAKMALTPGSHTESMYSVGAAYRFNFK